MDKTPVVLAAVALLCFAALVVGNIVSTSPTNDETTHLTSGYTALRLRDYRTNPEHPPLAKMAAAVPLLFMDIWPQQRRVEGLRALAEWEKSWSSIFVNPTEQWRLAWLWLYGRKDAALTPPDADPVASDPDKPWKPSDFLNDSQRMFVAARISILLFGLAGGIFVFLWSRALWGAWGAAVSTLLYAFDPSFIAHSGVVTTDVAMATLSTASIYFFWRALQRPSIATVAVCAITFGLAQATKFSAVLLVPIFILLAIWHLIQNRGREWKRVAVGLAAAAAGCIVVIWGVYGFRFAPAADDTGSFYTDNVVRQWQINEEIRELGPDAAEQQTAYVRANAQAAGMKTVLLFAKRHRLFPETYIHGVAYTGTTTTLRTAFLNGEFTNFGFLSYFFWTTLYKTPIPALLAIVAGVFVALRRRPAGIAFLIIPAVFFLIVAVWSRFNIGHRHILHVFPFIYILCGSLGSQLRKPTHAVIAALILAISSSVVFAGRPAMLLGNHLAYLNEIAGGPRRGYVRINDSNFDWGQDLKRLGVRLRDRNIDEPIELAYFGTADPRVYGIRFYPADPKARPLSRWFAVSATHYVGIYARPEDREQWRRYLELTKAKFVDTAGWSILIFEIP